MYSFGRQILLSLGIGFLGIAFVAAASGIALEINALTDEWFACIAFIILWTFIFVQILIQVTRKRPKLLPPGRIDCPLIVYWLAMYGFCLTALCFLGISSAKPRYFLAGILFMIGTLFLAAADVPEEKPAPNN